jgi:molybdopterin-binding protein
MAAITRQSADDLHEIGTDIGGGKTLTSVITGHNVDARDLRTGKRVSALFDAGHVVLVVD